MLTTSLFAPSSPPMTRFSHSMASMRIMTKSTCAFCLDSVTREKWASLCTRLSKRYSWSLEYRSCLGMRRMRRKTMAPGMLQSKAKRRQNTQVSYEDAQDELLSAPSLMQERKAQELVEFGLIRGHHYRACRLAAHQRGRPQGRRKECSRETRGPERVVHHPCEGG